MKPHRKNKFFTLIFSFVPGAAEMYMGFMKQGLSLLVLFVAGFAIPVIFYIGDIFMLTAAIVWAYSFFHARNIAALSDEEFAALEDDYLWNNILQSQKDRKLSYDLRKWVAGILIVFGVSLLWRNFSQMLYWVIPDYLWNQLSPLVDRVPQVAIAVVIIIAGMRLIAGKKEELKENE